MQLRMITILIKINQVMQVYNLKGKKVVSQYCKILLIRSPSYNNLEKVQ